jgi:DNA-binding NarL/FixJ family response regulator
VHAGRRFLSPKVASIVADQVVMRSGVSPLDSLSKREREILQLVAEGRSSAQIGGVLHISPKTVDTYRSRLMQKLKIGDVAGLVKFAIQHGLTSLE